MRELLTFFIGALTGGVLVLARNVRALRRLDHLFEGTRDAAQAAERTARQLLARYVDEQERAWRAAWQEGVRAGQALAARGEDPGGQGGCRRCVTAVATARALLAAHDRGTLPAHPHLWAWLRQDLARLAEDPWPVTGEEETR